MPADWGRKSLAERERVSKVREHFTIIKQQSLDGRNAFVV